MKNERLTIKKYRTVPLGKLLLSGILLCASCFMLFMRFGGTMKTEMLLPMPTKMVYDTSPDTRILKLEGAVWYMLQLGVYENKASADKMADAYRARGAAGYVMQDDKYRVLAAAYPSRADAQSVQTNLKSQYGVEAYLYELQRAPLSLRLSGQKAQLDALTDAFAYLAGAGEQLHYLSLALDKKEWEMDKALESLSSDLATVNTMKERLNAVFPRPYHPSVAPLIDLFCALGSDLEEAKNKKDAEYALFCAAVKHCHLTVAAGLYAYAASF